MFSNFYKSRNFLEGSKASPDCTLLRFALKIKGRMDQLWSGGDRGKLKIIRRKYCPNTIASFKIPTRSSPESNPRSYGDRLANNRLLKA
jgi:hypothetical protein